MVLGAGLGMGSGTVMLGFVFSYFLASLGGEFGWSRTQISGALFLIPAAALLIPAVGSLIDKHGGLRVAVCSIAGLAIGYSLLAVATTSLVTFYALLGLTLVLGLGTGPITYSRAVVRSFNRGRGMALAIALSGSSLSAIALPPALEAAIAMGGWRAGFLLLAGLAVLVGLPAAWIGLRGDRPGKASPQAVPSQSVRPHLRTRHLYLLIGAIFCMGLPVFGLVSQLRAMVDDRGFEPGEAVLAVSLVGLGVLIGRILAGVLIDRVWAPGVAAAIAGLALIGALVLTQSGTAVGLTLVGIVLIAVAQGAELDLIAFLTARYFPAEVFARLYGIVYLSFAISLPLGGLLFATSFDRFGSYNPALIASAGLFALASLLFAAMGPYKED